MDSKVKIDMNMSGFLAEETANADAADTCDQLRHHDNDGATRSHKQALSDDARR